MDNTRTRFVLAERCDDTSPCCDNTSPCALHDGSDANDLSLIHISEPTRPY